MFTTLSIALHAAEWGWRCFPMQVWLGHGALTAAGWGCRRGWAVNPCCFMPVGWWLSYKSKAMKTLSARLPSWSILPCAIVCTSRNTVSLFSSVCSPYTDPHYSPLGLFQKCFAMPCQLSLWSISSCCAALSVESPWCQASLKSLGIGGIDVVVDPALTISTGNNFNPHVWGWEKRPTTTQAAYYCTMLWATNQIHKEPSSTLSGLIRLFWQHLCHLKMGLGQPGGDSQISKRHLQQEFLPEECTAAHR